MKNLKYDLFAGFMWIIIAILQTFVLGWRSYALWIAVIVIWIYIWKVKKINDFIGES